MKRITLIILAITAFLTSCTINRQIQTQKLVSVEGTGSVYVAPDLANLEFIVNTAGWIANQVISDNAVISSRVIKALNEAGINPEEITLSICKLGQEKNIQAGRQINGRYTGTSLISVKIKDFSILPLAVDSAVKAGANGLHSISYTLTDKSTALRQARILAIKNTQDSAALLAGASGTKLGSIFSITEKVTSSAINDKSSNETDIGNLCVTVEIFASYILE